MVSEHPRRRRRRALVWAAGVLVGVLVLAVVGLVVYANVGRMAAESGPLAEVQADPAVLLTEEDGAVLMEPADGATGVGLIFIPGAKVEPLAYASMLAGLVREGVTVVITEPTLRLAILDLRAPDAFTSLAPEVSAWAIGGHSLGGVRACQLVGSDGVQTLILFASYCASDITERDVSVLTISGSEDGLSTPEKIADAAGLLPADASSVVIDGANHASFGAYGTQAGDGVASIAVERAHEEIVDAVLQFLG